MGKLILWTCLLVFFLNTVILAKVVRTGVFIGNNVGLINEHPLKYADKDAQELADIFKNSSEFKSENIHVLLNKSVSELVDTLQYINRSIVSNDSLQNIFLFYYSGHGSADALHTSGGRFSKSTLDQYLKGVQAEIKLVVVDACESGDLLRKKGGIVLDDIKVESNDQIDSKGIITITSSAPGELSLESEKYQGSVFSHHFKNGLKGLADYNSDRKVNLWEAYHYAKVNTNGDNISKNHTKQHPSFDFNIVGQSDLELTHLNTELSRVAFTNMGEISLEFYEVNTMKLYSSIRLNGKNEIAYTIPKGVYIISYTDNNTVRIAQADLTWSDSVIISPKDFIKQQKVVYSEKGMSGHTIEPHIVSINITYYWNTIAKSVGLGARYSYKTRLVNHNMMFFGTRHTLSSMELDNVEGLYTERWMIELGYSLTHTVNRFNYFSINIGGGISFLKTFDKNSDKREYLVNNEPSSIKVSHTQANILSIGVPVESEINLPVSLALQIQLKPTSYIYKDGFTQRYTYDIGVESEIGLGYRF